MSFPTFAVPPKGEFARDALGNPLPDECLLVLKHIDRLERENAALREDKEILDWLDANVDAIMLKLQPNSLRLDVREIVRKARKEGQP